MDLRPSMTAYLRQQVNAFQDGFRHNVALLGPVGSGKSTLAQQAVNPAPRLARSGAPERAGDGPACTIGTADRTGRPALSLAGARHSSARDPEALAEGTGGASTWGGVNRAESRVTPIYCALHQESSREFLKRFVTAMLHAAVDAPADAPLETLLQRSSMLCPRTTTAIQHLERYATSHLQAEAFVHALDVIPLLYEERQQPCVLVLDEFLHLEDLGVSHAFHELGKRVMTWPFVLFLMTSSSAFRARAIIRERLHLLFGQFELVTLGTIEEAAAMPWIEQELPAAKRNPLVSRFLLHWIGGYPWYLDVVLTRMRELTMLKRQRGLTETMLFQAVWDVLGSPNGVLYQWCAAQIERLVQERYGVLAREALLAIARGARTTQAVVQQGVGRRYLSQALQLLVERDLVQRQGACWVIPNQLLSCWLVAVLSPTRHHGSLDPVASIQLFDHTMKAIWGGWLQATTQPLAERVGRLFAKFQNETISLDHKTGRLPSFQAMNLQRPLLSGQTYLVADGEGRRWCCLVHEGLLEEPHIAAFEQFCRTQSPRPSRKVVMAKQGLELNAKLLAKESNMWVWELTDMNLLFQLYGQPPLSG